MSTDYDKEAREQVAEIRSRGPWLATASGRAWSINDPRPEDVRIEDIIAGLGRTCRWSGQLRDEVEFYSVAEHSTVMTLYAIEHGIVSTREDAMAILLHDALEAPYFDAATPVKDEIPGIRQFESRGEAVIQAAFECLPSQISITKKEIKELDLRIRIDEREQIIADPAQKFGLEEAWEKDPGVERLGVKLKCLTPFAAMEDFGETFLWVIESMPRMASGPDPVLDQALRIAPKYLPCRDLIPYEAEEEASPSP